MSPPCCPSPRLPPDAISSCPMEAAPAFTPQLQPELQSSVYPVTPTSNSRQPFWGKAAQALGCASRKPPKSVSWARSKGFCPSRNTPWPQSDGLPYLTAMKAALCSGSSLTKRCPRRHARARYRNENSVRSKIHKIPIAWRQEIAEKDKKQQVGRPQNQVGPWRLNGGIQKTRLFYVTPEKPGIHRGEQAVVKRPPVDVRRRKALFTAECQQHPFGENVTVIGRMERGMAFAGNRHTVGIRSTDHEQATRTDQRRDPSHEPPGIVVMFDDVIGNQGVVLFLEPLGMVIGRHEGIVAKHVIQTI